MLKSLCLLVYNLGQRELRNTLKRTSNFLKNQLGNLTNTPTLRWIFQCFQGVHLLTINQSQKVVNLTEERSLILQFLPSCCQKYYLWCAQLSDGATHRYAIALLATRKLIDALNWSVVAPVFSAANRTLWFTNNSCATHFFMFYLLICWLKF